MTKARDLSQVPNASLGFKNRIINGDMRIDQRNAGASVAFSNNGSSQYSLDRWQHYTFGAGAGTIQRVTDAPAGFVNSVRWTVTTPDATIAGSDDYFIGQAIEGLNMSDLGWGTANAQPTVLSFWVKCSSTGTLAVGIQSATTSYVSTVTINQANTWEYKTVTIAGPTSGTFPTDNTMHTRLFFSLGNSKPTTANTWASGNFLGVSGATNFMATNGLTFQITGVQLEKGSTATSFDYRPYGTELALCQRYYWRISGLNSDYPAIGSGVAKNTSFVRVYIKHPVSMRTFPTFSYSNPLFLDSGTVGGNVTGIQGAYEGLDTSMLDLTSSNSLNANAGVVLYADGSTTGFVQASAEL